MLVGILALLIVISIVSVMLSKIGPVVENKINNIIPQDRNNNIIPPQDNEDDNKKAQNSANDKNTNGVIKFSSAEDFKSYLADSAASGRGLGGGIMVDSFMAEGRAVTMKAPSNIGMQKQAVPVPTATGGGAERFSETNVQVAGIDEPDIVKTDGKEIYAVLPYYNYPMPMWEIGRPSSLDMKQGMIAPIPPEWENRGGVKAVKATPPSEMKIDSTLKKNGQSILLRNNILIVFDAENIIYGYDISDPANPTEKWNIPIKSGSYIESARLYKDKIYVISKSNINYERPCPMDILDSKINPLTIRCADIYHPIVPAPVDSTYTVFSFSTDSGEVANSVSFVGASGQSVIYVSENAIYATYYYQGDFVKYIYGFLSENRDVFPAYLVDKIEKLQSYDLSDQTKMTEFNYVYSRYLSSLTGDDRLKMENEIRNKSEVYGKNHKRELEKTGIVKIELDNLKILASGNVPGRTLNQFSLDEYNKNLRIATTVGWQFWGFNQFGGASNESVSDVYVLNDNLKEIGSVKDLGETERIYSARFIEDKGYIVTFRQTDPFYVLDLSNPSNPELKGELKIPGYSSYLHPINKDKIIGVGKEDNLVKISLFDVSNPEKPVEDAKYTLDEYWTDVMNSHHAFLIDKDHRVFFMPGGKGGYVFSYENDRFTLKKAVSEIAAQRAVYINDYLYIIGQDKIAVIDENSWERAGEMKFY